MTSLPLIPSRDDFRELAKQGNLIPVYTEFVADCETPIGVFRAVEAELGPLPVVAEDLAPAGKSTTLVWV